MVPGKRERDRSGTLPLPRSDESCAFTDFDQNRCRIGRPVAELACILGGPWRSILLT